MFAAVRSDIEGHVRTVLESTPSVADRLQRATREEKWVRNGRRAQLFPHAIRPGLGAGRRRGIRQGPDYRAGHQRRIHRRRSAHHRAGRRLVRTTLTRRRAHRLSNKPGPAGQADVRVHLSAGDARTTTTAPAAPVRRTARQSGRHQPVLCRHHRFLPASDVHASRQPRADLRGCRSANVGVKRRSSRGAAIVLAQPRLAQARRRATAAHNGGPIGTTRSRVQRPARPCNQRDPPHLYGTT